MAAKSGLKFRRIGRARAFAVMLGMIGVHATGGFRAALGAACDFIRIAIVYGVSAGAQGLHARSQTANGEGVTVELHLQIWRMRRRAWLPSTDRYLLTQIAHLVANHSTKGAFIREAAPGTHQIGNT